MRADFSALRPLLPLLLQGAASCCTLCSLDLILQEELKSRGGGGGGGAGGAGGGGGQTLCSAGICFRGSLNRSRVRGQRGLNKLLVGFSQRQLWHIYKAEEEDFQKMHRDVLLEIDWMEIKSLFSKSWS